MKDMDKFTCAYVEAMLWSSTDDDGTPLDTYHDAYSFDPDAMDQILRDCEKFQEENETDLAGIDPDQAGHDFWLTRAHHGSGYWDRDLGEIGDRLTAAAHAFAEIYPYVGDDGKIYF